MVNTNYSEKQLKIISGEIPLETIKGKTASALYLKALANNDTELAEKAYARLLQAKAEAVQRNRDSGKERKRKKRQGTFQWRQPKSNEYTEHQKQIVRGEIPLESVHTNELISIHKKAYNVGDHVLAETVLNIIEGRREITRQKDLQQRTRQHKRDALTKGLDEFDSDGPLTKWEQSILAGLGDLDEVEEEDILHIIHVLEESNDAEKLEIAGLLLLYKRDPSLLYVAQNHWDAVDKIEDLLQLPIRRPKTWFA